MTLAAVTQQSLQLLLLLSSATVISPFLFMDRALSPHHRPPPPPRPHHHQPRRPPYPPQSSNHANDFFQHNSRNDPDPDPDTDSTAAELPQRIGAAAAATSAGDEVLVGGASSPYLSRHSSLMMAAGNPRMSISRIGLRSSLIGSVDTCHVDRVKMSIRPPRRYAGLCFPTTEISYGCRGGCHSYSRIDGRNASNVLRSCSCCRPTGFGFRPVKMQCEGFALRTTVKFALGCHCRPCMASVESADIQTLRDLLRSTSLTNIG